MPPSPPSLPRHACVACSDDLQTEVLPETHHIVKLALGHLLVLVWQAAIAA